MPHRTASRRTAPRRTASRRTASRRASLAVPILAVVMLAAGCGGDQPVGPLGEQGADPVVPATGSPGAPPAGQVPSFTPRTVAHQHADITIEDMEVSQQTPRSYGEAAPRYGDQTYAYLSVTVANRLNHAPLLVQDGIFLEVTGELVAHEGRSPAVGVISAGATATGFYGFPLPPAALADVDRAMAEAVLVLGEPGHRQERLPLTGPVPQPEFPMPVTVDSPGTVLTRNGCPLEVEVTEAHLAHWVGFDEGGRSHVTSQALADRLMLHLRLAVTAPPGSGGCFLGTGSGGTVHLVVDGDRLGDIPKLNSTTNVSEGTTAHQFLVYDIPAAGEVEIEWGQLGGPQQRTPIPLP